MNDANSINGRLRRVLRSWIKTSASPESGVYVHRGVANRLAQHVVVQVVNPIGQSQIQRSAVGVAAFRWQLGSLAPQGKDGRSAAGQTAQAGVTATPAILALAEITSMCYGRRWEESKKGAGMRDLHWRSRQSQMAPMPTLVGRRPTCAALASGPCAMDETDSLRVRFEGALLGLAVGDAFCAPYEGGPLERLAWALIGRTKDHKRRWTDDTQMALDLVTSLLACGRLDQDDVARRFAASYRWSRGYGPAAAKMLKRIRRGMPWQTANRSVYSAGSYGNGAAMRSPVIGLLLYRDPRSIDAVASQAAEVTHAHPLAIDGAKLIAYATALAVSCSSVTDIWNALVSLDLAEPYPPEAPVGSSMGGEHRLGRAQSRCGVSWATEFLPLTAS